MKDLTCTPRLPEMYANIYIYIYIYIQCNLLCIILCILLFKITCSCGSSVYGLQVQVRIKECYVTYLYTFYNVCKHMQLKFRATVIYKPNK